MRGSKLSVFTLFLLACILLTAPARAVKLPVAAETGGEAASASTAVKSTDAGACTTAGVGVGGTASPNGAANQCSGEAIDSAFKSLVDTCERPHKSNFHLVCNADGSTKALLIICDIW